MLKASPGQRERLREQRVIGAIIARPWLIHHALRVGLHEFAMSDADHRAVVRAMLRVVELGPAPDHPSDMARAIEVQLDGDRLDRESVTAWLAAMTIDAERALGHGRRPDARALDMLIDDIEAIEAIARQDEQGAQGVTP